MQKRPRKSLRTQDPAGAAPGAELILHRETLRALDRAALESAAAGATYYCHSGGYVSACSNC
jgi:hypothetical protein